MVAEEAVVKANRQERVMVKTGRSPVKQTENLMESWRRPSHRVLSVYISSSPVGPSVRGLMYRRTPSTRHGSCPCEAPGICW